MTLTDIIGYLPHVLAVVSEHSTIRRIYGTNNIDVVLDEYRPVLRPMSDLITEITEKEYNDGKPFVPIDRMKDHCFDLWRSGFSGTTKEYQLALYDAHKAYDLLHAWHFDYRGLIEQGDAVNVHDLEKNPYEN